MPLPQTLKRFLLFLYLLPLAVAAQINTDRVMLIGRNALYYDDYVLSIQYFNEIINAEAGCTIASHCGPKTFALFYMKK